MSYHDIDETNIEAVIKFFKILLTIIFYFYLKKLIIFNYFLFFSNETMQEYFWLQGVGVVGLNSSKILICFYRVL